MVSTDLGKKTRLSYNVSLGIFMDLNELLEWYQSGYAPVPYPLPINISGFSQEDLLSDLLGFSIAYQEDNPNPPPDAKADVRDSCQVVGLDENGHEQPDYQQKQLAIYIKHFANFTTNTQWFSPLVDCSVCKPDPDVLKYMFSNFSPVGPSPTGPWQWVSAKVCNKKGLYFCGSYDTDLLNDRWWK